ncbi:uncharacterized protein LOC113294824 [Papaver somniferum]|uniref:uncharacterized protein LOC113294824 n=1 Tax=Papaver somniferum TaxID=3469 RepID=UPI000E6F9F8D|nr:uncharacterized protein LOC113294824 [Papaver somniferum]
MGSSTVDFKKSVDLVTPVEESPSIDLIKGTNDRCAAWRFSLIGRLDLLRLKFSDAVLNLKSQWKLEDQCKMIPLGKLFFTIKLDNERDQSYIKAGKWEVLHQDLWIRNWIPNFHLENHRTSYANIWVHLPGLSLEYWDEKTLFTICSDLGDPVKVDEATLNFENGMFARVLINIDLAKKIPHKLWIKTKFGGFMQDVVLTKLPKFCQNCKIVGHLLSECRVKKVSQEANILQKNTSPLFGSTSLKPQDKFDSNKAYEDKSTNSTKPVSPTTTLSPPKNTKKLDICFTPVTHINQQVVTPQHSMIEEETVINVSEEECNLDPTRISQIAEENAIEKSVIKYINGKDCSISEERVPSTSWSRIIQKPASSNVTSTSETQKQGAEPKVKILQATNKYNFRKNQGKGGTKGLQPQI